MTRVLFALFCLARLVQGTSINSTTSDRCLPPDGTTRSLGSILGSCALTLLICVWHTVHFNVPRSEWEESVWFKILCSLAVFIMPEVIVAHAAQEWQTARAKVEMYRAKGYKWSMTHSFFAEMGGFVYRNEHGTEVPIDCDRFLELYDRDEILNPIITVRDIRDKSKSDWIGKAIFAVHLTWFIVQVVVRSCVGLAVTLVELDTVCMAIISLVVVGLWWYKPLCPERPHVFVLRPEVKQEKSGRNMEGWSERSPERTSTSEQQKIALSDAWKPDTMLPHRLITCWTWMRKLPHRLIACWRQVRERDEICTMSPDVTHHTDSALGRMITNFTGGDDATISVTYLSLSITWFILGGLHLTAWDFEFPTRAEKIAWRVSSFVLAGSSVGALQSGLLLRSLPHGPVRLVISLFAVLGVFTYGVIFRAMLVGLMLASLRALPCSAYQTVSWANDIPHL